METIDADRVGLFCMSATVYASSSPHVGTSQRQMESAVEAREAVQMWELASAARSLALEH